MRTMGSKEMNNGHRGSARTNGSVGYVISKEKGKLLAAVMVLAVVLAAGIVVLNADESNADVANVETLTAGQEIVAAGNYYIDTAGTYNVKVTGGTVEIYVNNVEANITFDADNSSTVSIFAVNAAPNATTNGTILAANLDDDSEVTLTSPAEGNIAYVTSYDAGYKNSVSGAVKVAIAGSGSTDVSITADKTLTTGTNTADVNFGVSAFIGGDYTYYPAGYSYTNNNLANSDVVTVKDGTANVAQGENRITLSGVKGAAVLTAGAADITLTGNADAGSIIVNSGEIKATTFTVAGTATVNAVADAATIATATSLTSEVKDTANFYVFGNVTQRNDATPASAVTVSVDATYSITAGVTVYLNAAMVVNGEVKLYGLLMNSTSGPMTITVNTPSKFTAYNGSSIQDTIVIAGTGTIDLGGAMKVLEINGNITTSKDYPQTQTLVITRSLNIVAGTNIVIKGQLVVEDGVTLTIEKGATLEIDDQNAIMNVKGNILNYGTLTVSNSKSVTVSGSIDSFGSIVSNAMTINNGGEVTIENTGSIEITALKFDIKSGGSLTVYGEFDISAINNSGTITLSDAAMGGSSVITLSGNNATVDVQSYTNKGGAYTLTVKDDVNSVILSAADDENGFSGLIVAEKLKGTTDKYLDISGTLAKYYKGAAVGTGAFTMTLAGDVTVSDKLDAREIAVINNGTLTVSGEASATSIDNNAATGKITVTGTMTLNTAISSGIVNAAFYSLTG